MSDPHLASLIHAAKKSLIGARAEIANIMIGLRDIEDCPGRDTAVAATIRLDGYFGNAEVALCVPERTVDNA